MTIIIAYLKSPTNITKNLLASFISIILGILNLIQLHTKITISRHGISDYTIAAYSRINIISNYNKAISLLI